MNIGDRAYERSLLFSEDFLGVNRSVLFQRHLLGVLHMHVEPQTSLLDFMFRDEGYEKKLSWDDHGTRMLFFKTVYSSCSRELSAVWSAVSAGMMMMCKVRSFL